LRSHRYEILGGASVCILLVVLPAIGGARLLDLLIITLLFAVMAAGLYLVVGLCQLFDLGYAGFVCLGAYTTGVLLTKFHWGYLPSAFCAVLIAMAAGILLGLPTLPLRGDYFAIVTFGFAEIVILLMRNWTGLTGGPYGLGGIPDPIFFGIRLHRYPPLSYYFLLLLIAAAVLIAVWLLRRTMLGSEMIAVGDDEKLCVVTGIDVVSVKVAAFALSAGIGGLVGSFWAVYFKFISYLDFTLNLSVQIISIVILAGDRRIRSLLLATAVIAPTNEILRTWLRSLGLPEASRILFFGVILILLTLWRSRHQSLAEGSLSAISMNWIRKIAKTYIRTPDAYLRSVYDLTWRNRTFASEPGNARPIKITNQPVLVVANLHVSFGGTTALNGIDLALNQGEAVAVVGPNGSGKTSLLNAVCGLVQCTGAVQVFGRDVAAAPNWLRGRLGIERTFQHPRRFQGLNLEENLRLASFTSTQPSVSSLLWRIGNIVRAAFTRLPSSVKDSCFDEEANSEISARLQLDRAFGSCSSVILLDEPLAGKPPAWRQHVLDRIRNHKSSGGSLIVVEHNVHAILPVIDRILMLDKGRIKFLGSVEDYLSAQAAKAE
jgi:branched-chain amino acid transport system permease protein